MCPRVVLLLRHRRTRSRHHPWGPWLGWRCLSMVECVGTRPMPWKRRAGGVSLRRGPGSMQGAARRGMSFMSLCARQTRGRAWWARGLSCRCSRRCFAVLSMTLSTSDRSPLPLTRLTRAFSANVVATTDPTTLSSKFDRVVILERPWCVKWCLDVEGAEWCHQKEPEPLGTEMFLVNRSNTNIDLRADDE